MDIYTYQNLEPTYQRTLQSHCASDPHPAQISNTSFPCHIHLARDQTTTECQDPDQEIRFFLAGKGTLDFCAWLWYPQVHFFGVCSISRIDPRVVDSRKPNSWFKIERPIS